MAVRPGMRDQTLKVTIIIEDDAISTRAPPSVRLVGIEDGELVIWFRLGELEAFVVVVDMRVTAATDGLASLIVGATLIDSLINVGLIVAGGAAGIDTLALDKRGRSA